jgi:hypothetical protein
VIERATGPSARCSLVGTSLRIVNAEQLVRVTVSGDFQYCVASATSRCELIQKTILGSLNRAKQTIARIETAGIVAWRLNHAGVAHCQ